MTAEDPLIEAMAYVAHEDLCVSVAGWPCEDEAEHRALARKVYAAIAATGRLLPDGGTTEIQHLYRDPNGFTMVGISTEQIHDGDQWRLTDRRTVTRWPDDRWHFTPWEAVDDHA